MPPLRTHEQYVAKCKSKKYDLPIETYKTSRDPIDHQCLFGHVYSRLPKSHLKGQKCPVCCRQQRTKTHEQYVEECRQANLDLPVEPYTKSADKINHKCANGHVYNQVPSDHLRGKGCPSCNNDRLSKIYLKTHDIYVQECKDKDYDPPLEKYVHCLHKIKHRCSLGHEYAQTPNNHLLGHGCSVCKHKTERILYDWLKTEYKDIQHQKQVEWCKNVHYMPFDFAIEEYNVIIELDGEQHFKQVAKWHLPVNRIATDVEKAKKALQNGYVVIRIAQIDVFRNSFDWRVALKALIMQHTKPTIFYLSKDRHLYDRHKEGMSATTT